MKKKHFAGVLMLTAAVALGTVSPVALPNTTTVVKAASTVNDISDTANKLQHVKFEVTGEKKVKIYSDDEANHSLNSILSNKFTYGFGVNKGIASSAAITSTKTITVNNGIAELTLPNVNDLHLVILDKTTTDGADKVLGMEKVFTRANPANVNSADDAAQITSTDANLEYCEVSGPFDDGDSLTGWKSAEASGSNYLIPVTAEKVAEGQKKTYAVRTKASSATAVFASTPKAITIQKKTLYTVEDLKKITYKVTDDNKIKFTNVVADEAKSGKIRFQAGSGSLTLDGTGTVVADNVMTNVLDAGHKVIVYVEEKNTNSLEIEIKKAKTPVVTQAAASYQLVASAGSSYLVKGDYKVTKGGTSTKVTSKDGKISVPGEGSYDVVALGDDKTKKIEFEGTATKTAVELDSDPQSGVVVNKLNNKIGSASLGAITLTTSNAAMKLTIGNIKKSLALEGADKDKVQYGYEGDLKELTDASDEVEVPMKEGKFVIEVVGNDSLKRTINFKGVVDKDGNKFKPTYASSAAVLAAMGTPLNKYKVRLVSEGAAFAEAAANSFAKEGKYEIKYTNPTENVNVDVGAKMDYLLPGFVTIEIKKEAAPSSPSNPVIPSGGGSAGGSTDTKKDDAKKTDDKKNDTKKDGAMSDGNGAAVDKQSSVTVKNTKKNTVKISEEKIAEALETGLKVTGKSGEVKFTAKALEKIVGDTVEAVKVTLKATSEMAKNVKGSKLVSKQVFTLNIKAGNMTVKESQLNGTKINVTLKVNLKKAPKIVWVMDLSTGKRVKAAYKKGKLMFKTANLGKFVLVNKAK